MRSRVILWRGEPALLAGVIWLATVSPLTAQRWAVGLQGGMNAARVSFENPTADALAKATPGLHLGAVVLARIGGPATVRSGLAYTQKGFDSDDEQVKLAYLEVPLFLQVDFPVALAPRLFAGPVASFEVGCESRRVPGVGSVRCDDVLAGLKRATVDFGLALGAGVGLAAGPGSVVVDLWANSGLTNINRETTPPGAARNRALYVILGYVLPLGAAG